MFLANPLYDKLTLSRAAHMQSRTKRVQIKRPEENILLLPPLQNLESDETTITVSKRESITLTPEYFELA